MNAWMKRAAGGARASGWGRLLGLVLVLAAVGVAGRQALPLSHSYFGNLPKEGNQGWHVEAQGIDHDESHWYFSQNPSATFAIDDLAAGLPRKCSVTPNMTLRCPDPRLWRTPAAVSLGEGVSCGNPATSGSDSPVCTTFATAAPEVWALGYDHFGDISFYAPDAAHRYVCVPIEGGLKDQPDLPGAFAFFRADDLSLAAWAVAPGLGTTSAWCAIDATGHVYSSPKNAEGVTDTVLKFRVDWAALGSDTPQARVELVGAIALQDEDGAPLVLGEYLQGGTFANATLFYMLNGQGDGACPGCGIHAFELTHATAGGSCGATDGDCVARRVAHSSNGSGAFNFEFHPGWSRYEEPEGLTWWDLSAPGAPAVPGVTSSGLRVDQTQLHAILLDNDYYTDDVYVKHYHVELAPVPSTHIQVSPLAVDFGDTDVGGSELATVGVTNVGPADLTLSGIDLGGGNAAFTLTPVVPPVVLRPGESTSLELRFTPVTGGLVTASLMVTSDDPVQPQVAVPVSGEGVSLVDQAAQLLEVFDDSLAQGLLVPLGPGWSADRRAAAFRQMLVEGLALLQQGDVAGACVQFQSAYLHVDGLAAPADLMGGQTAAALAGEIAELRAHLGCP
jgi:hypothetical protein